jgi:hypothetical protein
MPAVAIARLELTAAQWVAELHQACQTPKPGMQVIAAIACDVAYSADLANDFYYQEE